MIKEGADLAHDSLKKCRDTEHLNRRITIIENAMSQQNASASSSANVESQENLSVAIYGLPEYDDVTKTTNQLFADMHLEYVTCVSVHRTPRRSTRPGVVIAQLRSLQDKHAILERKRSLRSHPLYRDVYIKSSKSHAEQVMDANFNVVLNEMLNGDAYYMSDNGRILRKPTDMNMYNRNHIKDENNYTQNRYRYNNGGARPKNTYNHSYADAAKPREDNSQQGYRNQNNTKDTRERHYEGYHRKRPEQQSYDHDDRQQMDHNRLNTDQPEDNRPTYNSFTQQYNDKFTTPHHTQQHSGAGYYMDPTKK